MMTTNQSLPRTPRGRERGRGPAVALAGRRVQGASKHGVIADVPITGRLHGSYPDRPAIKVYTRRPMAATRPFEKLFSKPKFGVQTASFLRETHELRSEAPNLNWLASWWEEAIWIPQTWF